MKLSYVYILTNKYRTTFYVGVTSNLQKRILEHIEGKGSSFTSKYNLTELIYYEEFNAIEQAISREKQLKSWRRAWKLDLVKKINPTLETLHLF